jgi:hypothetical protein
MNGAINAPCCVWTNDPSFEYGGNCTFNQPPTDFAFVSVLFMLTQLLALPLCLLYDFLIKVCYTSVCQMYIRCMLSTFYYTAIYYTAICYLLSADKSSLISTNSNPYLILPTLLLYDCFLPCFLGIWHRTTAAAAQT